MKKKSPDLKALVEAVEDGRIDIWVDGNGIIQIFNKRSKRWVEVDCTEDMGYDPFRTYENNEG